MIKEGRSTTHPLVLDGSNYVYWYDYLPKIYQQKNLETKPIIIGWTPLEVINVDGTKAPKAEKDWTEKEDETFLGNSRALNATFNGGDKNVFRLINTCVSAKEASLFLL